MLKVGVAASDLLLLTSDAAANYGLEDDRVDGLGGNDDIRTGAGNDYLKGGAGDDLLFDGDGDDTVFAGGGDDTVQVDAGNDIYHGGDGNDFLWFDRIHYGASGQFDDARQGITFDLARTSPQNLGEFGIDSFIGFEKVVGTYGNDSIYGTSGSNRLDGNPGNDLLDGRGGNDTLEGGLGTDTLIGGLGADTLYASDGIGNGVIRYDSLKDSGTTTATRDVIKGFTKGQDKIDLGKIDANLGLKGNQAFKVVTGFTKAFGEVRLVKSGNDTLVQIDGDKDNSIDMTILVKNAYLTMGDFIL